MMLATLPALLAAGVLMSLISLVGGFAFFFEENALKRVLTPMVALAAGSMIGGALFHMIPAAVETMGNTTELYSWIVAGFCSFFMLEQFLHWHHCHKAPTEVHEHQHGPPVAVLILAADAVHNFIGGLAIGGSIIIDVRLGAAAFLVAAAHEIPQELGDFAVLVHGGMSRSRALAYNFLSSLTFLAGCILAYGVSTQGSVAFLLPLAAGNFLYIGAADLVPEINRHDELGANAVHLASFLAGIGLLLAIRVFFE